MKNNITKIEYLSAFLDDEVGSFEQKRILSELQKDDAMRDKVASFSLIGEAMRNDQSACAVQADFLSGIQDKIADEPMYNNVKTPSQVNGTGGSKTSFLDKPIVNMSLAAGLGAVAVLGFNMLNPTSPLQQQVSAPENTYMIAKTPTVEAQTEEVSYVHDEAWRERLRSYVNQHAKYASTSAIIPSVRAISYSTTY